MQPPVLTGHHRRYVASVFSIFVAQCVGVKQAVVFTGSDTVSTHRLATFWTLPAISVGGHVMANFEWVRVGTGTNVLSAKYGMLVGSAEDQRLKLGGSSCSAGTAEKLPVDLVLHMRVCQAAINLQATASGIGQSNFLEMRSSCDGALVNRSLGLSDFCAT